MDNKYSLNRTSSYLFYIEKQLSIGCCSTSFLSMILEDSFVNKKQRLFYAPIITLVKIMILTGQWK